MNRRLDTTAGTVDPEVRSRIHNLASNLSREIPSNEPYAALQYRRTAATALHEEVTGIRNNRDAVRTVAPLLADILHEEIDRTSDRLAAVDRLTLKTVSAEIQTDLIRTLHEIADRDLVTAYKRTNTSLDPLIITLVASATNNDLSQVQRLGVDILGTLCRHCPGKVSAVLEREDAVGNIFDAACRTIVDPVEVSTARRSTRLLVTLAVRYPTWLSSATVLQHALDTITSWDDSVHGAFAGAVSASISRDDSQIEDLRTTAHQFLAERVNGTTGRERWQLIEALGELTAAGERAPLYEPLQSLADHTRSADGMRRRRAAWALGIAVAPDESPLTVDSWLPRLTAAVRGSTLQDRKRSAQTLGEAITVAVSDDRITVEWIDDMLINLVDRYHATSGRESWDTVWALGEAAVECSSPTVSCERFRPLASRIADTSDDHRYRLARVLGKAVAVSEPSLPGDDRFAPLIDFLSSGAENGREHAAEGLGLIVGSEKFGIDEVAWDIFDALVEWLHAVDGDEQSAAADVLRETLVSQTGSRAFNIIISPLVERLKDSEGERRTQTVRALGEVVFQLDLPEDLDTVVRSLADTTWDASPLTRSDHAFALGQTTVIRQVEGDGAVFETLVNRTFDGNKHDQQRTMETLGFTAKAGEVPVSLPPPFDGSTANSPSKAGWDILAETLGKLTAGASRDSPLTLLVSDMRESTGWTQKRAARVIGEIIAQRRDPETLAWPLQPLVNCVVERDSHMEEAAMAIGIITKGNDNLYDADSTSVTFWPLIRWLRNKDSNHRRSVAIVVGRAAVVSEHPVLYRDPCRSLGAIVDRPDSHDTFAKVLGELIQASHGQPPGKSPLVGLVEQVLEYTGPEVGQASKVLGEAMAYTERVPVNDESLQSTSKWLHEMDDSESIIVMPVLGRIAVTMYDEPDADGPLAALRIGIRRAESDLLLDTAWMLGRLVALSGLVDSVPDSYRPLVTFVRERDPPPYKELTATLGELLVKPPENVVRGIGRDLLDQDTAYPRPLEWLPVIAASGLLDPAEFLDALADPTPSSVEFDISPYLRTDEIETKIVIEALGNIAEQADSDVVIDYIESELKTFLQDDVASFEARLTAVQNLTTLDASKTH